MVRSERQQRVDAGAELDGPHRPDDPQGDSDGRGIHGRGRRGDSGVLVVEVFAARPAPEHAELQWLFNTVTPLGDLGRMTQFKDKSERVESVSAGLLNYPVLQAADILLYLAEYVPVGEDGDMDMGPSISKPGDFVDLYAESDVLAIISNCPQINNPVNDFNPTPVQVTVWQPA